MVASAGPIGRPDDMDRRTRTPRQAVPTVRARPAGTAEPTTSQARRVSMDFSVEIVDVVEVLPTCHA